MFEFLTVYGLLALTHLFTQINFSHREYLNSVKEKQIVSTESVGKARKSKYFNYSVGIVIPSYNEKSKDLENCVKSTLLQNYQHRLLVVVIDDGSKDKSAINKI